ncbi:MAG: zinc ribbon domain-containing protein, partial [Dehalococcoidales bacterium]|nr:zinc ribbon domain-containing protein [Dehalococcoidales bacterium]
MPTYEYHCHKCNKKFDKFRPMSEYDKPADCPICGTSSERIISAVACFTSGNNGEVSSVSGGCSGCSSSDCSSCS